MRDRVGLGWRPELAGGILSHLDRIDVVEVIADDYFEAGRREMRALRTLTAQVPVVLHGVSLGLASTAGVEPRRLDAMARVVGHVEPAFWSEHLAFVRGGGLEIGHLAAPPRTPATVEGTARNVERARRVVGRAPVLENVATLIDPPGSTSDEVSWVSDLVAAADVNLLLDLHNLHANAINFGFDARAALHRLPLDRVRAVHLAGGRWIGRLLDDHLHDAPDAVFALLTDLATLAAQPLTVILERDGNFPPFERLLAEIERARAALRRGRARRVEERGVSALRFEAFLAELYVDPETRRRFLDDPRAVALRAGLDELEADAMARIDRTGLALAARSFAIKRRRCRTPGLRARGRRWLSRLLTAGRRLTGERRWR